MKSIFSNATLMWDEREIEERDVIVRQCVSTITSAWSNQNSAIRFRRVETPTITPLSYMTEHIAAGFDLLETSRGFLRPETTAGTIAAFQSLFPMSSQRNKALPYCVWQFGKSYRNEQNSDTLRTSRLRLAEFYQLEFELFAATNTKTDYLAVALSALCKRFGGKSITPKSLPHYSRKTIDWEIHDVEVAGCSERTDWPEGIIYEVSIGIDRLCSLLVSPKL